MYEAATERLLPRRKFILRMLWHSFLVIAIMAASLGIGMAGFMAFEDRSLIEAFLHASYILSGFGLVEMPVSTAGKLFAGFYGMYASLFFLVAVSVVLAPVVHRILHRLNLETLETGE